jgi:hypothetical protein
MIFDAYAAYCQHQLALGRPAPSREWWDKACATRSKPKPVSDVQFDRDREAEGDAQ